MTIRPIVRWPHPVLKAATSPVHALDDDLRTLLQDLADTLRQQAALGLSAPQIGSTKSACIVNSGYVLGSMVEPLMLVNPVIVWQSPAIEDSSEGCLSAPGLYLKIPRSDKIRVQCRNAEWKEIEFEASGFLAMVIQHEVDHLNGKMMWDRLSMLRRDMVVRKLAKGRI